MSQQTGPAARLDHYRLERRLALGGMAEIFLATDERNDRTVAVKRLLPQVACDRDFIERFFHEIQIQIALKHRNIVELLDCSPDPERPYIVMEYVDGGSLHGLRTALGKLPWELSLFAAQEALAGLAVAHRKGIVHRDVKPHNLMWTTAGAVKLADFGISHAANMTRLTVTGTVVGTPSNMSPEQARGDELDGRSDLFSLGTTAYELVTGFNPYVADSVAVTLRRVTELEPESPSFLDPTVPPSLDALLARLSAKAPAARFADADEAGRAVRDLLSREGIGQPHETFRAFVADPPGFVAERQRRLLADSRRRAEALLADASAPPEEALWAAYRTLSCAPADDPAARTLYETAVHRAGQRRTPVENGRIRELEAQLRKDPSNVALLLQLAKLYRLEHDFVNVMRFFRKLQAVSPNDPYTQGQIASLVGGTVTAPHLPPSRRAPSILPPPPPAEPPVSRRTLALSGLAAAALLVVAVSWAKRPPLDLEVAAAREKERAEKVVGLLRASQTPPPLPSRAPAEDALQKTLEKGALVEKEEGTRKALDYYRERLAALPEGSRPAVLLTMCDLVEKEGDLAGAIALLDEALAAGGSEGSLKLRKGGLLWRSGRTRDANELWEELARVADPEVSRAALFQLAVAADRAGDDARALTLYETVLARGADAPEANAARLGAAALRAERGDVRMARRLYEEVLQRAPTGSDLARTAQEALRVLP